MDFPLNFQVDFGKYLKSYRKVISKIRETLILK